MMKKNREKIKGTNKIRSSYVQSIERALTILEALSKEEKPLELKELAKKVKLHKTTTHRILKTLMERGYVENIDSSGVYKLGLQVLKLSGSLLENIEVRREAKLLLEELRGKSGETVHLGILEDGEIVYIEKIEGTGPLHMASGVGKRVPLYCTALGKAILAYLEEKELNTLLKDIKLEPKTPNTITSIERLKEELIKIRALGYSIDNIENEEGIRCVGAPIFDSTGEVVAAISVSGAAFYLPIERIEKELGPLIKATAVEISKRLGWGYARKEISIK